MKKYRKRAIANLKKTIKKIKKRTSAFTLVEILVVIVILGVIPLLVFTASASIRHSASVALVQADLEGAAKQVRLFYSENDLYPTTISCSEADSGVNKCLQTNPSISYNYVVSNTSPKTFCIEATKGDITYNALQGEGVQAGPCPDVNLQIATNSVNGNENIQGNKWNDNSGKSNNGNLENGAGYNGSNGGGVGLDGVDDYVDVPYKLNENQGSIAVWYYAKPWYQYQQIIDNSSNPDDWEAWIDTEGVLHARIKGNLNVFYDLDNMQGPGHWYHIVITWKKSKNLLTLHVNGSQKNSKTYNEWAIPGDNTYFGGGNDGNTKGNGSIRSIKIDSKVMSDDDVESLFDDMKHDFGY